MSNRTPDELKAEEDALSALLEEHKDTPHAFHIKEDLKCLQLLREAEAIGEDLDNAFYNKYDEGQEACEFGSILDVLLWANGMNSKTPSAGWLETLA